jgi:hypothetical protein
MAKAQRSQAIIHTDMFAMNQDNAPPGIKLKEAVDVMKTQLSSIKADKRFSLIMASTALIN